MSGKRTEQGAPDELWHSGKVTRRRLVGWGAGVDRPHGCDATAWRR